MKRRAYVGMKQNALYRPESNNNLHAQKDLPNFFAPGDAAGWDDLPTHHLRSGKPTKTLGRHQFQSVRHSESASESGQDLICHQNRASLHENASDSPCVLNAKCLPGNVEAKGLFFIGYDLGDMPRAAPIAWRPQAPMRPSS